MHQQTEIEVVLLPIHNFLLHFLIWFSVIRVSPDVVLQNKENKLLFAKQQKVRKYTCFHA